MEVAILILLVLALFVFVLPIVAIIKASEARNEMVALRKKLAAAGQNAFSHAKDLEERIEKLEGQLEVLEANSAQGGDAITKVVKAREELEVERLRIEAEADRETVLAAEADKIFASVGKPVAKVASAIAGEEPGVTVAAPKVAKLLPAGADAGSIEMKLGTYWFVRIGVVLLLTGAGILAYYKKQFFIDLSPGTKVAGLYGLSALMGGLGFWLQRGKEAFKNYGQVLLAGGISGVYFTTYAAHIFEPVKVIPDATVALLLLLVWGGFMVWLADRLKSETLAMFAIGASYYATYVPLIHTGQVSHWVILASNLILAVAAVVFMLRNRWLKMPVLSMAAAYLGFGVWRLRVLEQPSLFIVLLFAGSLWIAYTAAVFLSRHEGFDDRRRSMFLTANNAAMFGLASWEVLRFHEDEFWRLPMVLGSVLLGCALAAASFLRDQKLSRAGYLTQGLVLVALGVMTSHLSESMKGPIFAAESVVLLVTAVRRKNVILQVGAFVTASLAMVYGFSDTGQESEGYLMSCSAIGVFLLFNGWWSYAKIETGGTEMLRSRVSVFTGGGLLVAVSALVAYGQRLEADWLPWSLLAVTAAMVGSIYLLRLREFVLLGLGAAAVGIGLAVEYAHWAAWFGFSWPLAVAVALALGLAHWWRWQRGVFLRSCAEEEGEQAKVVATTIEAMFSAGVVLILLVWLRARFGTENEWLLLGPMLAIGIAVYGWFSRAPYLAAFGQAFLVVGCLVAASACGKGDQADAVRALVPIATAWLGGAILPRATRRFTDPSQAGVVGLQLVYRVVAAGLGLLWIRGFVIVELLVPVAAICAGVFLLVQYWRPGMIWHWLAAIYLAVSALYLAIELLFELARWESLAVVVGVFVLQQIARRSGRVKLPANAHHALILGAGIALFFWSTVRVENSMPTLEANGLRSITWAVLAVVYFTMGLKLRERWHRLMGLGTLAIALISLFPIIWQMSTELKIVSFFVLGAVFVGLGFVYNRNREQINKLL